MLSAEKAKLKSALDKTKSHIQSEVRLNKKLNHTRGIKMSLQINFKILVKLAEGEGRELIADFRKSWFTVSQALVKAIKNKVNRIPSFTIAPPLPPWCSKTQGIRRIG